MQSNKYLLINDKYLFLLLDPTLLAAIPKAVEALQIR
jgi:hypothetical protein